MANPLQLCAVFLCFLTISPSPSARPLHGASPESLIASTRPDPDHPGDTRAASSSTCSRDGGDDSYGRKILPCEVDSGVKTVSTETPASKKYGGIRKYGPLLLNILPKGKLPPSGPSRGTNNLNH